MWYLTPSCFLGMRHVRNVSRSAMLRRVPYDQRCVSAVRHLRPLASTAAQWSPCGSVYHPSSLLLLSLEQLPWDQHSALRFNR